MIKNTILFYIHNFGGLGHSNRLRLIIEELLSNFGDKYTCILLNSGENQGFLFEHIKGLKLINLPMYDISDFKLGGDYQKIEQMRKQIFQKLFSLKLNIESLVIEHYPFGRNFLDKEINFLIEEFKNVYPTGNVFSSVRDIMDVNSLNQSNEKLFDRILIHSDEKIQNYESVFPAEMRNKIIYSGYVVEKESIQIREKEKNIYITIGGGQDGIEFVRDFLEKFEKVGEKNIYKLIVALGKSYCPKNIEVLRGVYSSVIEFYKYVNNPLDLKCNATLVVSMGGYNNMLESLKYNIKTIVYPRASDDEQKKRLKQFQRLSKIFYEGVLLNEVGIKEVLDGNQGNMDEKNINFAGAYFTASFLVNFGKYKYIKLRLTNACNAKCEMCGVIKRKREYNKKENISNSILDFYKLGGEVVNLTGGEPTIYKGFWDLLALAKGLGLITSVSTNGTTLGEAFFEKLYDNQIRLIDYIDISVDGLYEKQDERRNFKGLFKTISENLQKLLVEGVFIHINVTVRKDNISEMRDIFDYFYNIGVQSISFGMITHSPVNDMSHLIPEKNEVENFYRSDRQYMKEKERNIKISFSPDYISGDYQTFIDSICNKNQFEKPIGKICKFINTRKEIRINENGNITPCCEIDDFDEGIGNVNTQSLLKNICSKEYDGFLARTFPNISKACLTCKIEGNYEL